jgi:hypothetical protein
VSALALGMRLGTLRLASSASLVAVGVAVAVVALGSLLERLGAGSLATDRALVGIVFGIAVPVLAWGVLGRATAGRRLDESVRELARHGADRRWATAGIVIASAAAAAIGAALLAGLAIVATRFPADPRLASDLWTTAWIGLASGGCYAAWFALASTLGSSGGGRGWALVLDWLLGAGTGLLAVPWPRGHVKNLLGAEPVLEMPQWAAMLALGCLGLLYATVALARVRR